MSHQCRECRGTGLNQKAVAASMRELRESLGVSMRSLADRMELSPTYLSDLENAKRGWSPGHIAAYVSTVMALVKEKP